jgi:hypothetical protein
MDYERSEKHSGLGGGIPTSGDRPLALPSWSWPGIVILCAISVSLGYVMWLLVRAVIL